MPSMPSLLDIAERCQKGPKMDEKAWDLALFRKMGELAKKYEIACPADAPWFNLDEALLGRVFQAAIDFLVEMGVYCISSSRVVQFTEDEVLAAIRDQPSRVIIGEGRDQRVVEQRPLEYKGEFNFFPGHNAPFSEEWAPLVVQNFAQIPEASYIGSFNFTHVDGREIFGQPLEAYASRRAIAWMREGIRKAGRPGMAISYYPINTRASVMIAALDPDYGLRRTDGSLFGVLPDIKVELDLLTAAIVYRDYGAFRFNTGAGGRYGSFAGGYEGAIIEAVVKSIAGWLVYRDEMGYAGVASAVSPATKVFKIDRKMRWAASVICQTLNRYTNYIYFAYTFGYSSGPGTETCLLETALSGMLAPINGANPTGYRHTKAQMNSAQTPLETEFKLEIVRAVQRTGLTRQTAGKVLDGVVKLLEGREAEPPQHISKCYDLVHHQPSPAYQETYLRVKDQLAGLGLDFG